MTEAAAREILARLLELTPEPPVGAEIDQLLAAFDAIATARAVIIDVLVPPIALAAADRPLLLELERREALWQDTLAAARRTVGGQRCGAGQLRAYAQTP